jgi:hypothetical protein
MDVTTIILLFIAAGLCGLFDRLRGHEEHIAGIRFVDKLLFGFMLAVLSGYTDFYILLAITVAMIAGMSPGWGEPISSILLNRPMDKNRLEWYQVGPLETNPYLALFVRGIIWGLPIIPVFIYLDDPFLLAYILVFAISMPLGMAGRHIEVLGADIWGRVEYFRGWLSGFLLLAFLLIKVYV